MQAAHLGAKSSFIYTLKHLPIHATMSMWKYKPDVGYICLTAQANRAGLHHRGRQVQSMGLCPKHRHIKKARVFPTDNVGTCWAVELQLTQWRLQHPSILLTVSYGLDFSRVHQPPEVILVITAIEAQAEACACQTHHCGNASGGGVPGVLGF